MAKIMRKPDGTILNIEKQLDDIEAGAEAEVKMEETEDFNVIETKPEIKVDEIKPPVVETPKIETPIVETPIVETPIVETPIVETPAVTDIKPVRKVVRTPIRRTFLQEFNDWLDSPKF